MKAIRRGFRMTGPGQLEAFEAPLTPARPGWTWIEVLGCGVCHTDLGYLYDGVATAAPNLVLGHEIVGREVGTERLVLVPAVSPCGECLACRRGRRTSCSAALMPGNHHDGGFASHVEVPARYLCDVPALPAHIPPWQLAVIADAVTTPLQALRRAHVAAGEPVVIVGAGGVGGFAVALAHALGAVPAALDIDPRRLEAATRRGALATFDASHPPRELRSKLAAAFKARNLPSEGWHILECSGSPAGQALAFGLLTRGATLSIVGFTAKPVELRLSNLMAFDAEAYGNWGADPLIYPEALALVLDGKVELASAVQRFPLSDAPSVLAAVQRHEVEGRAVLVPNA
ncbi:MAG: 6-hydroxycyclohex-1-ene-1-carbonyl-CoA dehydrogenase [Deltaproteobacteria bacterium]|nr:6-hydroxycyclohex-1-ene-1-carbonyl-CoA dehydrogenase [Deltaproteobacteria bacterium]